MVVHVHWPIFKVVAMQKRSLLRIALALCGTMRKKSSTARVSSLLAAPTFAANFHQSMAVNMATATSVPISLSSVPPVVVNLATGAPFTTESDGIRFLHIGRSGDFIRNTFLFLIGLLLLTHNPSEIVQSAMQIAYPYVLQLPYPRAMMAFLLFVDPAVLRTAVIVGLGTSYIFLSSKPLRI